MCVFFFFLIASRREVHGLLSVYCTKCVFFLLLADARCMDYYPFVARNVFFFLTASRREVHRLLPVCCTKCVLTSFLMDTLDVTSKTKEEGNFTRCIRDFVLPALFDASLAKNLKRDEVLADATCIFVQQCLCCVSLEGLRVRVMQHSCSPHLWRKSFYLVS